MTPRQYLKAFVNDDRLVTGGYFSSAPMRAERGDRIGVVLMNLGGPAQPEHIEEFLYRKFMDPALIDMPVRGVLRDWLSRGMAKRSAKKVRMKYEAIGGSSPLNHLTNEQADALERRLNRTVGEELGVKFHTYVATRHGSPSCLEAAVKMQRDEIDKVVLLPLYPQYARSTTGSSLSYWSMLEQTNRIPRWPSVFVSEYAAHPKYVQAISERIDQALQRFSRAIRGDVHLVFNAYGTLRRDLKRRQDPYCCLIHSTVDRVMDYRRNDLPFTVAFQHHLGLSEMLEPGMSETLQVLGRAGQKAVLVVPVAFVTDLVETIFTLDVEMREQARQNGIRHFEVASALNCHPLFIEALADVTRAQLVPAMSAPEAVHAPPNGKVPHASPLLRGKAHPNTYHPRDRHTRCANCLAIIEARCWEEEPAVAPPPQQERTT